MNLQINAKGMVAVREMLETPNAELTGAALAQRPGRAPG